MKKYTIYIKSNSEGGTPMKYNLKSIMLQAHKYRVMFSIGMSEALKMAWRAEKVRMQSSHDAMFLLQMKEHWGSADREEYYQLRTVA